jgi:hypothetical protein
MHGGRTAFFVKGEGVVVEPAAAAGGAPAAAPVQSSLLKFGRLLVRRPELKGDEDKAMVRKLTELGECMNDPKTCNQQAVQMPDDDSDIPAGYTYLGQFITHEITFDDSNETLMPGIEPHNLRTPQVDLDSLYGGANGPLDDKYAELYDDNDRILLKVGKTSCVTPPGESFCYDLPRKGEGTDDPKRALIADVRNDENLPVAQTHLAFIKFHNRVVERLRAEGHRDDGLFECARLQVVRHFQWIIIHDYLPKLVDKNVLTSVLGGTYKLFKLDEPGGPTMPLEFSAAAFRIGHTMVRAAYDWNDYHRAGSLLGMRAGVTKLFEQTGFRRPRGAQFDPSVDGFASQMTRLDGVDSLLTLPSDWVIDWRRFYEFPASPGVALPPVNRASKLDTNLNFHLDQLQGFPDAKTGHLQEVVKAITVRNLRRGYYLGLPTGEEVAAAVGEQPLKPKLVADGPHSAQLSDPLLEGKTPLWYYILKEAELLGTGRDGTGGHRLGPVGSRIVAETLVGLIKQSPHSILDDPGWSPRFGRPAQGAQPAEFRMTDLLKFAFGNDPNGENSVSPLG